MRSRARATERSPRCGTSLASSSENTERTGWRTTARHGGRRMDAKIKAYWPLPLRIFLGIAFLYHGLPKLLGGHAGFVATLQHIGVPAPGFFSWVVTLLEVLGGIALIAGALVPVVAILFIVEMLVA